MAEETTEAPKKDFIATLRRGKRYVYGGVHYHFDTDVEVDTATKDYLEENAIDTTVVDGEFDEYGDPLKQDRPKFQFRKIGTERAVAPAPRRRRAPA